jgi:hypothetical protein
MTLPTESHFSRGGLQPAVPFIALQTFIERCEERKHGSAD